MHPLLHIQNLQISFGGQDESFAVDDISFSLKPGKLTAIVGESGSGKSVTALSILQLLPKEAKVSGSISFSEDGLQLSSLNKLLLKEINKIRGAKISMIFQEPMTSLNPVLTCGYQVMESLRTHKQLSAAAAKKEAIRLFEQVELPEPSAMLNRYPHQLSGGQKQRVMIALAISCQPHLLIADEPTTALDVRVQKNILGLLKKLQQQQNMSVLLITHDLALIADVADEIIVMYKGKIAEQGSTATILKTPAHDYTKALLACRPSPEDKGKPLLTLKDHLQLRPSQHVSSALHHNKTNVTDKPLLSVRNLQVQYAAKTNVFGKPISFFKAVDDVSFDVFPSETIGLVGESGCGKTTLGRAILRLVKPTAGQIFLHDKDISTYTGSVSRQLATDLQIVFQDPYGSLNPRISIGDAILEPLKVHRLFSENKKRKDVVAEMLQKVQLSPDHYQRFPHQFSGGQRQRICIARALVMNPSFLVFDESVSALDVSVQADILNLINELKKSFGFTSIFISHDISVVHYISDRIMVMHEGRIVESGTAGEIYFNPTIDYTRQLINAIPGKVQSS